MLYIDWVALRGRVINVERESFLLYSLKRGARGLIFLTFLGRAKVLL